MSKLQFFVYPAVTAFALAAAVSAHAQEGADYDFASSRAATPVVTVAQQPAANKTFTVRAARLAPQVDVASYDYNPYADFQSTKTRAEVMAEVLAVPRTNRLAALHGEDIGPFFWANVEASERMAAPRTAKAGKTAIGQ